MEGVLQMSPLFERQEAEIMSENPLLEVRRLGQSVWLDDIRRGWLESGELKRLIDEDGLAGVTSNPSIFHKAIGGSRDYDEAIRVLAAQGRSREEIYEALTVEDVGRAADLLRPTYDRWGGPRGFVSLEVNPHLAYETERTMAEARRLWSKLARPNVFIKVPATLAGLPAIRQLIGEGINVNVTLLFGLPRYEEVVEAYLSGLEDRAGKGGSLRRVSSVASFFLSRIDVLVDPLLEKMAKAGGDRTALAEKLRGQAALASAKKAFAIYKKLFQGDRFRRLADRGATPQWLLWASPGAKNPAYSDVKYVEPLIGPDTVNTMPMETLDAYRDHGRPKARLEEGLAEAEQVLAELAEAGIDIDRVTRQLEKEGVQKFNEPFDLLMETLDRKREELLREPSA
jgi:transaldolase